MKSSNDKELEEFRELLKETKSEDFDGHTEFINLTPAQKLEWLSQLIYFKYIVNK